MIFTSLMEPYLPNSSRISLSSTWSFFFEGGIGWSEAPIHSNTPFFPTHRVVTQHVSRQVFKHASERPDDVTASPSCRSHRRKWRWASLCPLVECSHLTAWGRTGCWTWACRCPWIKDIHVCVIIIHRLLEGLWRGLLPREAHVSVVKPF